VQQPPAATELVLEPLTPRYRLVKHEIVEGDTASAVLRALLTEGGTTPAAPVAADLLTAAGSQLDRLSIGDDVVLDYRDGEPLPWRLRVEAGAPTQLELVRRGDAWSADRRPVPYHITTGAREMVVNSSLWDAALTAGLRPSQVLSVAGIFEYDVDFNTELVKGARIRLAADTLTGEDGETRIGNIRGAVLDNGDKSFTAVRFVGSDGKVGWYSPDGKGRRRPFLRSPLEFSRVTSGFSMSRFHPILGYGRPHYGVDLGAPTGTPVRAVADGVVTDAGYHNGHGNFIELKHQAPYTTSYSHLSAILVKRGQTIHQGDVIGRVGMTGLATGPHLHYQFMVNGVFKDPMTIDLPTTGALLVEDEAAFQKVCAEVVPVLQAAKGTGAG